MSHGLWGMETMVPLTTPGSGLGPPGSPKGRSHPRRAWCVLSRPPCTTFGTGFRGLVQAQTPELV